MPVTKILEPLPDDFDKKDIEKLKQTWNKAQKELDALPADTAMNFTEFLQPLSLTEEEYILAVRSSVRSKTVFLKRTPKEVKFNKSR